ncbi:MAG: metallophosphoesterase family protein, partial [Clostridia bacterium]|nr:metallophosphoesterase family protein [Clostridia bacterium]
MRLLVATDLHGSKSAVDKVVSTFAQTGANKLVLLGDLYYHGPRNGVPSDYDPMYVANALNAIANSIVAVRGNCDSEV